MTEKLHVITCVANPLRWQTRDALARRAISDWLKASEVEITVVECAYGARAFALADLASSRVKHIGVRATTLAWSKECLLNIGVSRLPVGAEKIATLDADILFRRPHWASETLAALDLYPVIQPWDTAYDLGPHDEHVQTHKSFASLYHSGQPVVPSSANFWKFNGGPYEYAHCLPGDSIVVPGGRVLAASARPFEGHLVVIRTAGGKELACTPNHPILSGEHWVRADSVNVGDYVVSHVRGDNVLGEPHKQDAPARIEDIARSFSERRGMHRSTAELPDDFDDNRSNCKVAEVWADSFLPLECDAMRQKIGGDSVFSQIGMQPETFDRQGASNLLLQSLRFSSTPGFEAVHASNLSALFSRGFFEHATADRRPNLGALGGVLPVPRGFEAPASQIACQPRGGVGGANVCGNPPPDDLSRVPLIHADNLGAFRRALSCQVERDEVVYVGRREFKGHVYDLKTERGFILSDNIITHNSGYAWAWTRRALDRIGGLFDLGGMGSGDHHMALGMVGAPNASLPGGITESYRNAVISWSTRAAAEVNGKLGFVHGTVEHPFHGRKAARGYISRWDMFLEHNFDPLTDLKRNTAGVIEFAGNKPDLERAFDRYMRSRAEDVNSLD